LGRQRRGGPSVSDLDRFGDCQCIFKLDPEIPHGAVHLGVPEKELNRAKVSRLA
jgi:hypothetical protein